MENILTNLSSMLPKEKLIINQSKCRPIGVTKEVSFKTFGEF